MAASGIFGSIMTFVTFQDVVSEFSLAYVETKLVYQCKQIKILQIINKSNKVKF